MKDPPEFFFGSVVGDATGAGNEPYSFFPPPEDLPPDPPLDPPLAGEGAGPLDVLVCGEDDPLDAAGLGALLDAFEG
jgi:hypothetical protein